MSRASSFFGRLIFNNFWLKLISVVFALSFYAFIHSAQNAQRTVQVKLVIEKPPESLPRRLMSDIPPAVDVTLIGPLQQLEAMRPDELSITLNLASAESIPELKLTPDMIPGLPPRVSIDRIYPSRLTVMFEDVIERVVPVQIARTGTPAKGMEVTGKTIVEPKEISATGIRSAIETIQFARAEAFDVSGLGEGLHERQLRLDDAPDNVLYAQSSVTATVQIARKLATKEFDKVAVQVVGLTRAKTKPSVIHVVVTGPPEKIESLTQEDIVPLVRPIAPGEEIPTSGSVEVNVVVDLPNVQIDLSHTRVLVIW
jgi:YbbR domain-containing protein